MVEEDSKKISAVSARLHTRRSKQSSSNFSSGIFTKIIVSSLLVSAALIYQALRPLSPNICGSPNGPPITAPRIKLKDGRYLAYKEHGVPKDRAKYKFVFVHGFDSCRHEPIPITQKAYEELQVYLVSFDRPGYGESDPNPKRREISIAFDIEELADQLELGAKFHVIGYSMGGQVVWTCLKHIPHRLAGVTLLTPVVNYWWPGFPANLSKEAYNQQLPPDLWAIRVVHYFPWLTYWWNTQKWFPSSNVVAHSLDILCPQDLELVPKFDNRQDYEHHIRQQGEYESLHRDLMIGFGKWSFDPMNLENPFPNNEVSVHMWQGDEDGLVPCSLQRYIAQKLPWIKYYELPGAGHFFPYADGVSDTILHTHLFG